MAESKFVYITYIRTTAEKLWQALTEPEFTRQFWHGTIQDCKWEPGASWRIVTPDGRTADSGQVVEIEPYRKLVLTWLHHLHPEAHAEGSSRLTYTLEENGDAVKLTVLHEMDRNDSKLIKAISGGWPMILSSLKSLLETGSPLEATRGWPKGM